MGFSSFPTDFNVQKRSRANDNVQCCEEVCSRQTRER